jgi:parvulin-like peptidyl-prolyl isomerase
MTRYYENNKADFLRKTPEYKYLHIRVNTLKEALALRSKARGDNFAALARDNSLDTAPDLGETPFRKPSEIPACLHDVLDARPGWLSSPVSCQDGVYLVRLLDRTEPGTALPFPEVRASIAARLSMQHKEKMRESKIRQYKEGVAISLNVDEIPGQESGGAAAPVEETDPSDERLPPGE